jgi:microcystin degradation protein MlrC
MDRPLRIAIGGIRHETNTFSRFTTEYEHFRIRSGHDILASPALAGWHVAGIEFLPAFVAEALPGGMVSQAAYRRLKSELLEALRAALPLNGVYLNLHGAMEVEAIGSAEADLVAAVRALVGSQALISVSLDLHGNVGPQLAEKADILTAFRTAPHRDEVETQRRALERLIRCLRRGWRPVSVLVKVPLLLSGEQAVTEVEPARSLYARLSAIEAEPGLLDASLLVGCAWTDSPFTPASVIVVAENERALAQQRAAGLARAVWERRLDFRFHVETAPVDQAIRAALNSPARPFFITDSGDNVTAGGAGDVPHILERLLALGARNALVGGLVDSAAVHQCAAGGVGARVQLALGGKLDPAFQPLAVEGQVLHLVASPCGALLRLAGVDVILTTGRQFFTELAHFEAFGAAPRQYALVVVKQGYLFPELAEAAAGAIMALSPGSTDLRLEQLPYRRIPRPVFPLDPQMEWQPD